ncbi:putative disease resistance protein At3g14460 [Vigna radiata var. radiata]|uniref:Disease resistance protein At3g14460 n=1 Tax=Vigna radiata var. radiata TaxID=3916 RepID=A0A3Q0FES0_VIGRR|nr:putative disease resistance protein At3g14460 [Vigna radiata var. radiata]
MSRLDHQLDLARLDLWLRSNCFDHRANNENEFQLELICTFLLTSKVGLLYNLLILKLNYCSYLKELPSSLHKLTKLRCLEFEDTQVTKMPMHFGELKNLQVLSTFYVIRNNEVVSIKQLGRLNLHGRLSISELQNIENPLDALEVNLKNKHLVELKLIWNSNHIPDDPRKEEKVLENLQPSDQLAHLLIRSYCGTQFPSWVFDNSLSNLVSLELIDCKYCLCLPPLGLLSSLKTLKIRGFDGIVSIGAEFYGSNSSSFKSLESLEFSKMKEWEEWECKTTSFPRLRYLGIWQCPMLKSLSEQLLHLKELSIESCDNLIISEHREDTSALERLTIHSSPLVNIPMTHYDFIEDMTIGNACDSLIIFQLKFFPMLRSLRLERCQNIQRISQEHAHNHLEILSICACPQFESFPDEGLSVAFPFLIELSIKNCPKVEKFPYEGLPSKVKFMSLSSIKLIASLGETLNVNTCLQSLSINSLDVESFPDEVLLPPSITSLKITNCPNLKQLDYKLLYHLSSLSLWNCPNLQCLPEEGLPKSISSLLIWDCPLLKQRCQNPEGKDWRKIAHLEYLRIG